MVESNKLKEIEKIDKKFWKRINQEKKLRKEFDIKFYN